MSISLKNGAINYLFACRACGMSDTVHVVVADTQARVDKAGWLNWQVECTAADRYGIDICYSAPCEVRVRCTGPNNAIETVLPKSRGYFANQDANFERAVLPGRVELPMGVSTLSLQLDGSCAISSIELHTDNAERAAEAARIDANSILAPVAPYANGYGFMFHWVAQSMPREGNPIAYADAVELFDVEAFADTIEQAGGRYVFLTANHAQPHFPAPLSVWERYFPGMTTKRDLVGELARALERRGIALMLYINFTAAYFSKYLDGGKTEFQYEPGDFGKYSRFACDVFEEIGEKYRALVKGYWIDSCYQVNRQYVNVDFEPIYRASKVGYADRVTTFNYWILPVGTPYTDVWAGEVCDIIALPDARTYSYGCAAGVRPHALLLMEDNWWQDKLNKLIVDARFDAERLAEFIRGMNRQGGMATINLQIYQDGGIGQSAMKVLKELKKKIYSEERA